MRGMRQQVDACFRLFAVERDPFGRLLVLSQRLFGFGNHAGDDGVHIAAHAHPG